MDFPLAFNLTLTQFDISAKHLAQKSGVPEATISRFRNGHQIKTETLSRLLECLTVHQRDYFFSLLATTEDSHIKIRAIVTSWLETATLDELHQTLLLIGHKCVNQNSKKSQDFEASQSVA
ncbi:MAG: helix-turn-helix transcriptional regulator [Crinalium sp.]